VNSLNTVGPVTVVTIIVMVALVLVGGLIIVCFYRPDPHGNVFVVEPAFPDL
jgi:hypothetical protein